MVRVQVSFTVNFRLNWVGAPSGEYHCKSSILDVK